MYLSHNYTVFVFWKLEILIMEIGINISSMYKRSKQKFYNSNNLLHTNKNVSVKYNYYYHDLKAT